MMKTPIIDFVNKYIENQNVRAHMPGHKGINQLGIEMRDITEISGAGNLYSDDGIISESEKNASSLFGCRTFYSVEGSSQCIRAMLFMAMKKAKLKNKRPLVLASRNVHKTFISAAALLNLDVDFINSNDNMSYYSCKICGKDIDDAIKKGINPDIVYITSPDYLGNISDIESIAKICHENDIILVVDNAHGAYLKFLETSKHPIDLGADMCCDSAHKTFPALTGAAYLHLSNNIDFSDADVKNAMLLFGSTSPSYLIMQSLDLTNVYLEEYKERLASFISKIDVLKRELTKAGYVLFGSEPTKITISTKDFGYIGYEFGEILESNSIMCEFIDPDFVVLMLSTENTNDDLDKIKNVLLSIKKKEVIKSNFPSFSQSKRILSIREAMFSNVETIQVVESEGRIIAEDTVSCPPAIPIAVCGEIITKQIIKAFKYYGIENVRVVK